MADAKACSVEGCGRPATTRGWCMGHYTRWIKTGSVGTKPIEVKRPRTPGARCEVPACQKRSASRGLCRTHYERWRRSGTAQPDLSIQTPTIDRYSKICSIDGCDRPHVSQGYCGAHSRRWYKHGSAQPDKPILGSEPQPSFVVAATCETDFGIPVETPIATVDGWTTAGELTPGSRVFDEHGRIRYVTAVAPRRDDLPCYRVSLDDKTSFVAAEGQAWLSYTYKARHHGHNPKVVTTAEMAATPHYLGTSRPANNHTIVKPSPLDMVKRNLLIDPYVLGAWLGDGDKNGPIITSASWDAQHMAALIEQRGYSTKTFHNGVTGGNGRKIRAYDNLAHQIRALNLYCNKHFPEGYLLGSYEQRLDLLCGLMDTDGSTTNGRCEFSNTNVAIVEGFLDLVRSLGCHAAAAIKPGDPDRILPSGKKAKSLLPNWRISFSPTFTPFRLPRKVEAHTGGERRQRGEREYRAHGPRKWRVLTGFESVKPAVTVAIAIDGPTQTFLAGRGLVPLRSLSPV